MANNKEDTKKEAYAKVEAGIIALLTFVGESETAVRRFVELKINESSRG